MKAIYTEVFSQLKRAIYAIFSFTFFRQGIIKTINGVKIKFPFEYSRYYPSDYEPFKQKFIESYANGFAVDLGAHIGLYTVLLSQKATQVIAFEPTTFTRKVLNETLKFNSCKNVTVRSEMVTDASGSGTFYETEAKVSNANSLVPLGTPFLVSAIALDDLNLKVDFLKVDIEGAELLALRGAARTLTTLKYMTLEIHPRLMARLGQTVNEIFELLKPYRPIYYMEDKLITVEQLCKIEDHFEINVVLNGATI
ncbi:MAG: FkbM family methyltransferase [Chitinophagaceae bacterium]|nr:MAG: FkbM family methyltransferase [Chitinophagaceae bacterium]